MRRKTYLTMKKNYFLIVFVFIFHIHNCLCQITFKKYYSDKTLFGAAILKNSDSGYVLLSTQSLYPIFSQHIYVIKTDTEGKVIRKLVLGGLIKMKGIQFNKHLMVVT